MNINRLSCRLTALLCSSSALTIIACTAQELPTQQAQPMRQIALAIKLPAMPVANGLSLAGDNLFIPFHMAIRIEGDKNFVFSQAINSSQDLDIEVPYGELKIKASYMVEQVSKAEYDATPLGLCKGEKTASNGDNSGYIENYFDQTKTNGSYYEYVSSVDFNKNPTNNEIIEINLPDLKQINSKVPYAIKVRGSELSPSAKLRFKDAWTGEIISMPCKDGTRQIIQESISASALITDSMPAIDGKAIAGVAISDGTKTFNIPLILSNIDLSKNFYFLDFVAGIAKIAPAFDADFDNDGISNAAEVLANTNPLSQVLPPTQTPTWTVTPNVTPTTNPTVEPTTFPTTFPTTVPTGTPTWTPTVPPTTAIPPPSSLTATATTNSATISWPTVVGATEYAIYYGTIAGITKQNSTRIKAPAPSFTITSLTSGMVYYFRVASVVNTNESELSTMEATATTSANPPNTPPTGLYLSWPHAKAFQLHFTEFAGATSYKAYYKTSPGVIDTDPSIPVTNGQIINGLNSFGSYYVRVSALDSSAQESPLSTEASVTMPEFVQIPQNLASYNSLASDDVKGIYAFNNTIYAATSNGVSMSINTGDTWKSVTANKIGSNIVNKIYSSGNNIYAVIPSGLSISTDNGLTWTIRNVANISGFYAENGHIYYTNTSNALFHSADNGVNWTFITPPSGSTGVYATDSGIYAMTSPGLVKLNAGTWSVTPIAAHMSYPINDIYEAAGNLYAATTSGLHKSSNGGTWTSIQNSMSINKVYVLNSEVYSATTSGLYKSISSGTFTPISFIGFKNITGIYASGSNVYASAMDGIYISTDYGNNWVTKNAQGPSTDIITSIYTNGNNMYVGTQNKGLYISHDNAATWTNKTSVNGLASNIVKEVYALGSYVYAATPSGLSVSVDGGNTWALNGTLGNTTINGVYAEGANVYAATQSGLYISTMGGSFSMNSALGAVAVNKVYASGSTIYAATTTGLSIYNGSIWTTKTVAGNLLPSDIINKVYVVGNNIYAATTNGLSLSSNSGDSWTTILPEINISDVYTSSGSILYAASNAGIYMSNSSGASWGLKTIPYAAGNVNSLAPTASGVYAGTQLGIYATGL